MSIEGLKRQLEFFFHPEGKGSLPVKGADKARDKAHHKALVEDAPLRQSQNIDRERTLECAQLSRELGLEELACRLVVVWNKRMRSTAGRAFWPEGKIELNPKLEEVAPTEVHRTMLHELAHLVAYARAGRKRIAAHGAEWRQACDDLEIFDERATHSLPLPSRTMRLKWKYTCPACGEGFERARKMKRYAGCYQCCKSHNGGYYHKKFRLVETSLD